ncbi:MAG: ABC transporter permease [Desulfurococcales archaeon]|nr:ABC transporter permease [Desulfurococcales archaeon]
MRAITAIRMLSIPASFAILLLALSRVGFKIDSLIEASLLAMTPLALAAMGEAINEKGGLVNIGLEGIFLISAAVGVYAAEVFNNGWAGLAAGLAIGAFIGLIFGVLSVYGKADQIIVGIGINIFAIGFVPYFILAEWGVPGIHIPPKEVLVQPIRTPVISISHVTILAIALAFALNYMIKRTPLGLRIRAAGEAPEALDAAGVSIARVRILGAVVSGALTGLGGAFMPLAWFGGIVKEISAGRGFIALAVLVAAGLDPLKALGFAFLFGFAEGLAYVVAFTPGIKEAVPYHLVLMIPYIITLIVVAIFIGRASFPKSIGKPYRRE